MHMNIPGGLKNNFNKCSQTPISFRKPYTNHGCINNSLTPPMPAMVLSRLGGEIRTSAIEVEFLEALGLGVLGQEGADAARGGPVVPLRSTRGGPPHQGILSPSSQLMYDPVSCRIPTSYMTRWAPSSTSTAPSSSQMLSYLRVISVRLKPG